MSETKEKFNPLAVKIIIPFGRFASKLTKSGEKKLFIAREKTRALLIDRLISGESRGAYLVTGRRGVGKTSFVEACLEEYSNSVYMRFLRAGHGRGLPNLLLTALFFIFLLAAYLAASGMLELTIASANDNFLLYPAVVILFFICLSPLFLAYSTWKALGQLFYNSSISPNLVTVLGFIGTIVLTVALSKLNVDPIKVILLSLIGIYLLGKTQIFDAFRYGKPLSLQSNASLTIKLVATSIIVSSIILPDSNVTPLSLASFITSTLLLVVIFVMRYYLLPNLIEGDNSIEGASAKHLISMLVVTCFLAIIGGETLIIDVFIIFVILDTIGLSWQSRSIRKEVFSCGSGKKDGIKSNKVYSGNEVYAPPFETILVLKACFLVTGALQLAYPIVGLDIPLYDGIVTYVSELPRSYFATDSQSGTTTFVEIEWLALIFLGLVVIFLAEYNWIMRPFMAERENPVLGQAKKQPNAVFSHHDASRWPTYKCKLNGNSKKFIKHNAKCIENFRAIAKITFPWLVISAWIPAIIVRINLGFEVLKHQSVIFAMLHGMRTQYVRNLFSPLATSTLLINSVRFILLLLVVNMVAHYSFGLHNLAKFNSTSTTPSNPTLQRNPHNLIHVNLNYAQFETGFARFKPTYCRLILSPSVNTDSTNKAIWTKALCSAWPDFTNSLLPILYLELLPIKLSEEYQSRSNGTKIERFGNL